MTLIMITGLPGTGKTTLAQALAKRLHAKHFNTDIIRHTLGKRGQYDSETKALIYNELLKKAEAILLAQRDVVVDGTFYKKKLRQRFIHLAEKHDAIIKWIEIKASEDVVRQRVQQKRAYSEADFSVYLKVKTQYEPLDVPHLVLQSDQLDLKAMTKKATDYVNADT